MRHKPIKIIMSLLMALMLSPVMAGVQGSSRSETDASSTNAASTKKISTTDSLKLGIRYVQNKTDSLSKATDERLKKVEDAAYATDYIPYGIGVVALLLALLAFGKAKRSENDLKKFKKENGSLNDQLEELSKKVDADLKEVGDKLTKQESSISAINNSRNNEVFAKSVTFDYSHTQQNVDNHKQKKDKNVGVVIKYCNIGDYGNQGQRISERTMSDDPSNGYFKVELKGNQGTYSVNPAMTRLLLADLQTYQQCFEPFIMPAAPHDIKVDAKGTIQKEGKDWKVVSKMKITIL